MVPSKYEPEELFLHRPKANRWLCHGQMAQAWGKNGLKCDAIRR